MSGQHSAEDDLCFCDLYRLPHHPGWHSQPTPPVLR